MKTHGEWQKTELARFLEKNRDAPLLDSKTVLLANPKEKRELERMIKQVFLPTIRETLASTPFRLSDPRDPRFSWVVAGGLSGCTSVSYTFVLEDPERPLLPGNVPPWYCRGTVTCSLMDYMIKFEFFVHLPISFSLPKILRLLGDPMFSGMPPNLTMERGIKETIFSWLSARDREPIGECVITTGLSHICGKRLIRTWK